MDKKEAIKKLGKLNTKVKKLAEAIELTSILSQDNDHLIELYLKGLDRYQVLFNEAYDNPSKTKNWYYYMLQEHKDRYETIIKPLINKK